MSDSTPRNSESKISLMIVGAQKAGTTSLKNYLGQHPALHTHHHKEFAYFVDDTEYEKGYAAALKKYFDSIQVSKRLVAKSAGLYINELAIIRLKENNPECKLVLILRNPVERTYSSYLMEKNYGAIPEQFEIIETILENKDPDDWRYEFFIGMSLYCRNLTTLYRHFPREQIMLVRFEDLAQSATKICSQIFEWMNIDTSFVPDTSVRHNETNVTRSRTYGKLLFRVLQNSSPIKKFARTLLRGNMDYKIGEVMRNLNMSNRKYGPIPQKTLLKLHRYFEPYNNELSQISGIDFSSWNKISK